MASPTPLHLGEVTEMSELRGVRVVLAEELERLGVSQDAIDDALVMVSELAANTLEHTHQPAVVSLTATDEEIVVSVFDRNDDPPLPQPSDPARAGGRGLMIVDAFADRHGVQTVAGGGKTVWFALDRGR